MTSQRASLGGPPPPDPRRGLPRSTGSDVGKQELNKGGKKKERNNPKLREKQGEKKEELINKKGKETGKHCAGILRGERSNKRFLLQGKINQKENRTNKSS
jgi:hypothetical protein